MDYGKLCRERTNMSMVKPRKTEVTPFSVLFMKCSYWIDPFCCHALQLFLDDNGRGMRPMPGERLVHPGQKVVVLSNVSKFTPLLERFARLDCGLRTEVVLQLLVACESTCTQDLGCIGCLNAGCCFSEIRVSVSYLAYELSMDSVSRVERVSFSFFFQNSKLFE